MKNTELRLRVQGEGLSAGIQAPLNPPLVLVLKEGVTDRRKGYTHTAHLLDGKCLGEIRCLLI